MSNENPAVPPATTTPEGTSTPAAEPTTAENLFPDFFKGEGDQRHITSERQDPPETPAAPPAPTPDAAPKPPEVPPTPAAAKAPEYLDLSQISGKLVKVKVDGVETDVPVEDVVKNFQLDRHLTQRSQALAEQEKAVKGLQDELAKIKLEVNERGADGEPVKSPAEVAALHKRIESLEAVIQPTVQKQLYERGIETLDTMARGIGFDDFKAKLPDLQKEVAKNFRDPANPTKEELDKFDTIPFWFQTYQSVKLRELRSAPPAPPAPPTPPANPKAPVLTKTPPLPPPAVEEAGGASAGGDDANSQWKVRYDAALKEAQEKGTPEAWQRVIRLKREPVTA